MAEIKRLVIVVMMTVLLMEDNTITPLVNAQASMPLPCVMYNNLIVSYGKDHKGNEIPILPASICNKSLGNSSWYKYSYNWYKQSKIKWVFGMDKGIRLAHSTKNTSCPYKYCKLVSFIEYASGTFGQSFLRELPVEDCYKDNFSRYLVIQLPEFICIKNMTGSLENFNNTSPPYTTISTTDPPYTLISNTSPPYTTIPSPSTPYTTMPSTGLPYTTISTIDPPYTLISNTSPPYTTIPSTSTPYPMISSTGPRYTTIPSAGPSYTTILNASPSNTMISRTGPRSTTTATQDPTKTSFPTIKKVEKKNNDSVRSKLKKELDELDRKNISNERRKEVARNVISRLSNLTDLDKMDKEKQENGMKTQDLNDTVKILEQIVNLNISVCNLNILGPASNILDSRNTKSWRNMTDDKLIRDLVNTLENYGFQYGENFKNNPNASTIFQNHSNVQLHVKFIKGDNLSQEEKLFKFSDASFNLSPDALDQVSGTVVVVLWYKTINSILRNRFHHHGYPEINSKIITASVRPEPRDKFLEPVRISWNTKEQNESATCVFWEPELNENIKWKTDGCRRVKDKSDSNSLICECDHLTAFAVMDISRDMVSKTEKRALELISTIGCSVSLFGIFLTILTHALLWRRLQQNVKSKVPSQVLMHLCVAIGMTDILAILAGPAQGHEKFCTTVSILLYFFVLAAFGWMLCEGVIIYLQLVNVYTGLGLGGTHLKVFYVIGWGIPVVVVAALVGLNDREDFITKRACWSRGDGVLFWTFVGTIGIILLINLVIFILALRSALSSSQVNTARTLSSTKDSTVTATKTAGTAIKKAKVGLKGSAILLPLLGLTWVFGLLVFNRDTIVFKYLFAICNSLQGMMIFIFHVLINKRVHEAISREKKNRKTRQIPNIVINNTCGTLSTSDGNRRKSSTSVTPTFFKKNFKLSQSLAVIQNKHITNNNNGSLTPNRNKPANQFNDVILEDL